MICRNFRNSVRKISQILRLVLSTGFQMCGCRFSRAKFPAFGRKGLFHTQASFSQDTINGTQIVRFFSSLKINHFFVCPFSPCFPSVCVELAPHTVQFFLSSLDLINSVLAVPISIFCPIADVSCVLRVTIHIGYSRAPIPSAKFAWVSSGGRSRPIYNPCSSYAVESPAAGIVSIPG